MRVRDGSAHGEGGAAVASAALRNRHTRSRAVEAVMLEAIGG